MRCSPWWGYAPDTALEALVVWPLDFLGRSLSELIDPISTLSEDGIAFRSLAEQISTTTSLVSTDQPEVRNSPKCNHNLS
jgi:hypothetical protein